MTFEDLLDDGFDSPQKVFGCVGKKSYNDEDQAEMATYHFERLNNRRYWAYECRFCHKWHLSRKQWVKK